MKFLLGLMALILISGPVMAQQYVGGYTRSNGTYVQPYIRSTPNSTVYDNYSTRGNVNPYTGQMGTRNPYSTPSYSMPTYQQPSYNNYGYRRSRW